LIFIGRIDIMRRTTVYKQRLYIRGRFVGIADLSGSAEPPPLHKGRRGMLGRAGLWKIGGTVKTVPYGTATFYPL
jgi:hypothetical protein